jgi:hypothetical protein
MLKVVPEAIPAVGVTRRFSLASWIVKDFLDILEEQVKIKIESKEVPDHFAVKC